MKALSPDINYRVSRYSGWLMILVGLALDTLPIIVLIAILAMTLTAILDTACGQLIAQYASSQGASVVGTMIENPLQSAKCAAGVAGAGVASGAIFFLAPIIYLISTMVATFIAFSLFPLWFYFGKKYSMLSMSDPRKMLVNSVSFIITAILKLTPILNLLPTPTYGVTVWKHIQISREEDEKKHRQKMQEKQAKQVRDTNDLTDAGIMFA